MLSLLNNSITISYCLFRSLTYRDSLTLLERIDRKLNDLCNGDGTVTESDSFRGLEMAVQKTEDLLLDDVHMNDIRQLENVQKRNRVIR